MAAISPEMGASLLDFGGSLIKGWGDAKSAAQARKDQKELTRAQLIDRMLSEQSADDRSRAQTGLEATQLDPYAASEHLQRANAIRQVLGGARQMSHTFDPNSGMGSFQGGFQIPEQGFDVSALSPESLGASATDFYKNRAMVQPNVGAPDLARMGLGQPGADATSAIDTFRTGTALPQLNDARAHRQQMMDEALGIAPQAKPARPGEVQPGAEEQKKGTPWWKKALTIGGNIALPILTGGMSLPAQIAINAAAGAGMGALNGGKRGALTGGITGAAGPIVPGGGSKFKLPKVPAIPARGVRV